MNGIFVFDCLILRRDTGKASVIHPKPFDGHPFTPFVSEVLPVRAVWPKPCCQPCPPHSCKTKGGFRGVEGLSSIAMQLSPFTKTVLWTTIPVNPLAAQRILALSCVAGL